jgi:hypothetical protein
MKPLLLTAVAECTFLAATGMCNTAMFTSMAPNPSTPYQPLAATALFSLTGNQLTLQVTNDAMGGSKKYFDTDVLTGVFFSTQPLNLSPQSAIAERTVDALGNPVCVAGCDVGANWEYGSLASPEFGLMNGISTIQLPKFVLGNFSATGTQLGDAGYGLLPRTYNPSNGSALADPVYAQNSATFAFTVPSSFTLASIDHIAFVWGTSADEIFANGSFLGWDVGTTDEAPEPSTCVLSAAAVALLLAKKRSTLSKQ